VVNAFVLSSAAAGRGVGRPTGPRPFPSVPCAPADEDVVGELCSRMFASLPRRDQRERGEQYVRGLLTAPGRKSVRNIATHAGGGSAVQRLHHFVSGSTWDWQPIRAALASHLQRITAPAAWVVQVLTIPKSGEHSVGVARRFVPQLGQTLRGQQALGVWFASPAMSMPVNWRLLLPEQWVRDAHLRHRAELPEDVSYETLEESAAAVVTETLQHAEVEPRPVVLDVPGAWTDIGVLRSFAAAGLPLLGRLGAGTRLLMADPALPGYGAGPLTAEQILTSVRGLRRTVTWHDAPQNTTRTSSVVLVRVRAAHGTGTVAQRPLYLLGEWDGQWRVPTRIWLTDVAAPAARLLRLTKLTHRVSHDLAEVGARVGLRDYEGRSFRGWHRHVTLSSVAHTACLLTGGTGAAAAPETGSPRLTA